MLETERLDVVQVCGRNDRIPFWARIALERGLPVMAEKPMAMDLPTLEGLFRTAQKTRAALVPMHTMRGVAELAAVRQAVRAGEIGDPVLSFSQKTYKWGKTRPDFYRSRKTFPGLAPWVGIHAFDWLHWILGDVFTEVMGREGTTARPDFPACGSQAAFVLTMRNGGVASVTLDYLRPEAAPTHGDERLRIAGPRGVIETALIERKVTLVTADKRPRTLPTKRPADIFTQFAALAARRIAGPAHAARSLPHHGDRHQGAAGRRYRTGRLAPRFPLWRLVNGERTTTPAVLATPPCPRRRNPGHGVRADVNGRLSEVA